LEDGCALAILKSLQYAGIKFLRYLSVDTTTVQNYVVPIDALLQAGSLDHPVDSNLVFQPDPASLQFLPYASKTAMMFGNMYENNNTTSTSNNIPRCTRHLLESTVQQALEQHDLTFVSSNLNDARLFLCAW
jgi:glutamine synthetase